MANVAMMRITTRHGEEVACVMSYPNKPCALDAMAVEEGFQDFADLCRGRSKTTRQLAALYAIERVSQ